MAFNISRRRSSHRSGPSFQMGWKPDNFDIAGMMRKERSFAKPEQKAMVTPAPAPTPTRTSGGLFVRK